MDVIKNSFSTCLGILMGWWLVCLGLVMGCLCLCGGAAVLIGIGAQQQQEQALAENGGRGTLDNPIPTAQGAKFSDFTLRPVDYIFDATQYPDLYRLNETPAVGTTYAIVWIELSCQKAGGVCAGNQFAAWFVDTEGNEWGEPFWAGSRNDLDFTEMLNGQTGAGWQIFEVPNNAKFAAMKFRVGAVTLYTQVPPHR